MEWQKNIKRRIGFFQNTEYVLKESELLNLKIYDTDYRKKIKRSLKIFFFEGNVHWSIEQYKCDLLWEEINGFYKRRWQPEYINCNGRFDLLFFYFTI
jgi:hypothetical protein